MINVKYTKLNKLCIIAIVISIIIGFLNPNERYITFICNFLYPHVMFIYFINVKVARKASKVSLLKGTSKDYARDYYTRVAGNKLKIFMIVALCFINFISIISKLPLYSIDAPLMFGLSTVAEIAVVIIFSIRIWKEIGRGDEAVLCC